MLGTLNDDLGLIAHFRRSALPSSGRSPTCSDDPPSGLSVPRDAPGGGESAPTCTGTAELASGPAVTRAVARLKNAVTRLLPLLVLGLVPVLSVPLLIVLLHHHHNFAFDFHGWYWIAGHRVLRGLSPYALPVDKAFNYPAIAALLFVPFALLPSAGADWVFTLLVLAAVPATLRVLNVRDWRVYGIVMLWQPVVYGWETANVTLLLVLGVAAAWRFRAEARTAGIVIGLLISIKLFLLPLALWFIATRRYAALVWTIGTVFVLNAISWPALGFGELSQYAHSLPKFAATVEHRAYSLISLLLHYGIGRTAAYELALALAGTAMAAGFIAGRRGADRGAMTACLGASLLASPIVESHYLALLMVPLALTRPRLSLLWAMPLVLWLAPVDHPTDWQHALAICIATAVLAGTLISSMSWRSRRRRFRQSPAELAVAG